MSDLLRVRLKGRKDKYLPKKNVTYAVYSDSEVVERRQQQPSWTPMGDNKEIRYDGIPFLVDEWKAKVWPSRANLLRSPAFSRRTKSETFSLYEVVFSDGSTEELDNFLSKDWQSIEKSPLRAFVASFRGIYIEGYGAVTASDEDEARRLFCERLLEDGFDSDNCEGVELTEIDLTKPGAVVVGDGDY